MLGSNCPQELVVMKLVDILAYWLVSKPQGPCAGSNPAYNEFAYTNTLPLTAAYPWSQWESCKLVCFYMVL